MRKHPKLEQYIGQASLALALLAALIAALFLAARWFRSNSSRISAHISRIAARLGSSDSLRRFQKRHPEVCEFIIRRFEPGGYLGLHLTVGLLVSIAALSVPGVKPHKNTRNKNRPDFSIDIVASFAD